jgi:hypothetical protein
VNSLGKPVIRMGTPVWEIDGYDVWNPAELVFIISEAGDPKFVARTLKEAAEWVKKMVASVRVEEILVKPPEFPRTGRKVPLSVLLSKHRTR